MTTQYRIHPNTGDGEREITELKAGAFRIPSFTDPNKAYTVHPDGYCSCDRHRFSGRCEKHVELARAITKCRRLRFGSKIAEARVTELAHRVYAPVRSNEDFVASYKLLLDTLASRHATEGIVRQSLKRHGRVLLLAERKVA